MPEGFRVSLLFLCQALEFLASTHIFDIAHTSHGNAVLAICPMYFKAENYKSIKHTFAVSRSLSYIQIHVSYFHTVGMAINCI